MKRRVVVTGHGMVTPIGHTVEESWTALIEGKTGIAEDPVLAEPKWSGKPCQSTSSARITDFDPEQYLPKREAKRMDPFILYGVAAAQQAWTHAGLPEKLSDEEGNRSGCLVGVGFAGVETILNSHDTLVDRGPRRISPLFIPSVIANLSPGHISMRFNLRGTNWATSSASTSGVQSIGEAFLQIREGRSDLMVAGGAEAVVTPLVVAGFYNAGVYVKNTDLEAHDQVRPFDKDRTGFVLGEGAGAVVLEELESARRRGATILGEVVGYGMAMDGPGSWFEPDGKGLTRSIQHALDMAQYAPEQVDYINAHGAATQISDRMETDAIHSVFGDHAHDLAISSTKASTGHMLGAAGAVEASFALKAIETGQVPPTLNLAEADPACDLDYVPNEARDAEVSVAMSVNSALGGVNSAILLSQYTA